MSAKEQVKKVVDYFLKEPRLEEKTEAMGEGLMLGANLADEANEISKEVNQSFKQLQREYTENGNGAQTTAEINIARDGEQVLGDRLNRDFGNVNAQLAHAENVLNMMKYKNLYVSDFPRLAVEVDDTGRIQRAFDEANRLFEFSNSVGNSLYYQTIITVVFDPSIYTVSSVVTLGKGLRIESKGRTIILASNPNKTIDCFSGIGTSGAFSAQRFTFIGFKDTFKISTGDVDVSLILFEEVFFHSCAVGVDTVSFAESRSTSIIFKECREWGTDLFLKNYCDKAIIKGGWLYHTGNGQANILNYNNLIVDDVIAVPKKVGNSRWIDHHETAGAQGALVLRGSRFGAESGGIPLIYNYAKYNTNMQTNVGRTISIENCQTSSSGSRGIIHLIEIPNHISIRSIFGMYDNTEGIITKDPSLDLSEIKNIAYDMITIDIDHSVYQSMNFPKVAADLVRFLKENKPMPFSAKKESLFVLPPTDYSLAANFNKNLYKIGLVNSYSHAVIELDILAQIQNSAYFCKKKVFLKISNGTANNTVTTLSSNQVADEFQSDAGNPVNFDLVATVVNNQLEVNVINRSGNVQRHVVKGEVMLPYAGGNGRPVFLN